MNDLNRLRYKIHNDKSAVKVVFSCKKDIVLCGSGSGSPMKMNGFNVEISTYFSFFFFVRFSFVTMKTNF